MMPVILPESLHARIQEVEHVLYPEALEQVFRNCAAVNSPQRARRKTDRINRILQIQKTQSSLLLILSKRRPCPSVVLQPLRFRIAAEQFLHRKRSGFPDKGWRRFGR